MKQTNKQLAQLLQTASEDIQISGGINFRSMGIAVLIVGNHLTSEQKKDLRKLLRKADDLIEQLQEFWEKHPSLEILAPSEFHSSTEKTYKDYLEE